LKTRWMKTRKGRPFCTPKCKIYKGYDGWERYRE
jgi:endogenous inhibitor of DNA gyrase (YacG/DUF329 family)